MKSRRADDHEAKKDRLRRSAAMLLASDQFGAASVWNITRTAGLGPSTLAYYFGNHAALFWDVCHGHMTRLLHAVELASPEDMPPLPRLRAMAHAYAGVALSHSAEHRTVMAHARHLPKAQHGDVRMMQRWLLEAFASALRDAAVRDEAPAGDAAHVMPLALSLLALLNQHALWFNPGGTLRPAEHVEMALRMALREAGADRPSEPAPPLRAVLANEEECDAARRDSGADPNTGLPDVGAGRPARRRRP